MNLHLDVSTKQDFFSLLVEYKAVRNWQIQKIVDAMSKFCAEKGLAVVNIHTGEVRFFRPLQKVFRFFPRVLSLEEEPIVVRTLLFFDKTRDTYTLYQMESV